MSISAECAERWTDALRRSVRWQRVRLEESAAEDASAHHARSEEEMHNVPCFTAALRYRVRTCLFVTTCNIGIQIYTHRYIYTYIYVHIYIYINIKKQIYI